MRISVLNAKLHIRGILESYLSAFIVREGTVKNVMWMEVVGIVNWDMLLMVIRGVFCMRLLGAKLLIAILTVQHVVQVTWNPQDSVHPV